MSETPLETIADLEAEILAGTPAKFPEPMSAADLAKGSFPASRYTIADFVLEGVVNMLYGDGGVGKTTAAEQLGVAVAAGKPIFGRKTIQGPVMFVLAEDDYAVTKGRIEAQCKTFGVKLEDLPIQIWCLPGHDIALARINDDGAAKKLAFYDALAAQLKKTPGAFVVLDSLADIAEMSEKDRLPANTFLKKVLGSFCAKLSATILVLGHPSKAAMADGSYHSGSTAFRNAVRNMLVMKPVKDSPAFRTLAVHKSNYGPAVEIKLLWTGGIFKTLDSDEVQKSEAVKADVVMEQVFRLIDNGSYVSKTNQAAGYTPKDIAKLVNKLGKFSITDHEVKDILLAAEADRVIKYIYGHSKTPAHFERRSAAVDFIETPADSLMHPASEIEVDNLPDPCA